METPRTVYVSATLNLRPALLDALAAALNAPGLNAVQREALFAHRQQLAAVYDRAEATRARVAALASAPPPCAP